jgi:hypothetical protein
VREREKGELGRSAGNVGRLSREKDGGELGRPLPRLGFKEKEREE